MVTHSNTRTEIYEEREKTENEYTHTIIRTNLDHNFSSDLSKKKQLKHYTNNKQK